jgi:two-component system, LytTR family, response regulator
MAEAGLSEPAGLSSGLRLARQMAAGFLYWLVFLLVLEPDNILRAIHAGSVVPWREELARLAAASLLGSFTAPPLLALVRRFPVEGKVWVRRAFVQLAAAALIAAGLIVVSCLLASWFLVSEHRPLLVALQEEFVANWLLLIFCIAGFIAIAHAVRFFRQFREREIAVTRLAPGTPYLSQIQVKARGRVVFLELDSVDWIEAQGNYVAFHAGPDIHLVRERLARLEPQLDPANFSRIHRSTIVAVDRIREITALGAGDALLKLANGTELRLSRNFRERLAQMTVPDR